MRLAGVLRQMQLPPLSSNDMERLMFPLLSARQKTILEETGGIDFAHIIFEPNGDETRFRVNLFRQRGRLSLVARRVNTSIPDFEGLGLPPVMGEIASHDQGIVILAGVTGSGKSTTIAAMLQYVNTRERCHIVTIEDPIEFTFKDDKCIINQREVGIDVCRLEHRTEARGAARPGHHPGRRNARPRDVQRRHARRRDRPPGVRNDPRLDRPVDDQPYPRPFPAWTCTRRCGKTWRST